jgi:4-amino-4-deoxy-L-arabinose transferase-like glycosyltransferase
MSNPQAPAPQPSWLCAWLAFVWAAMFAIALSGAPNLMDNEWRIGSYVLDVVQNGNWVAQHDVTGDLSSKPPLLTWLAALSTLCFGKLNRFSLYWPSALATLGVALTIFFAGRKHFGWRPGFLAALAYLLSFIADKQVSVARYDGLFALPVLWGALAAYRAWLTGRGWIWFWIAGTVATMTKGPLGLVLSASGLLAAIWERRSGDRVPLRGSHWAGVLILLVVCGGWLWLAYREMGPPILAKLFGREIVASAIKEGEHTVGTGFWQPLWNVLSGFFPWSLVAAVAFWRVVKKPAVNIDERRFERFLFCWVVVSLVLFSLGAHQRSRLAWPLVPAIALLFGREMDRLLVNVPPRRILRGAAAATAFMLLLSILYHFVILPRTLSVRRTMAMKNLASLIRTKVGAQVPLTYFDAPFAVQFYLNTLRPNVSSRVAAELLRGDAAAFVLARPNERLDRLLARNKVHELYRWPDTGEPYVRLLSNRPELKWANRMETVIGPAQVRLEDAKLTAATLGEFEFVADGTNAAAVLTNRSTNAVSFRVRWAASTQDETITLAPGESLLLPAWRPDEIHGR